MDTNYETETMHRANALCTNSKAHTNQTSCRNDREDKYNLFRLHREAAVGDGFT